MNPIERSRIKMTLNSITFAFAIAPVIYFFIALKMPIIQHHPEHFEIIKNMFLGIAIISVIAGLMIMNLKPEKFRKFAEASNPPSHPAQHQMLLAMTLHESIAVFGFVYYFMSGTREFLNAAVPVSIVLILVDRLKTKIEQAPPSRGINE